MIRFGVIGTNWITDRFVQAAGHCENFKLTAVYSRTEAKGREFADKYGAAHVFTDIAELAGCSEVDAVYVASPNSMHSEHAIECMKRGVHVLCEKPAASNAAEFERMSLTAREHGVLLMEAMKSSFLPSMNAIRDNLSKIGPVRRYSGGYCQYSSRYDSYKEGIVLNAFKPEYSNGALMDLGVYGLYPLVLLFGEPQSLTASAYLLESGVDGQGTILAKYEGMEAVVPYSKISDSAVANEIQGELGSILIDKISEPGRVTIQYRDGRSEQIGSVADKPSMFYEVNHFIECIRSGKIESDVNTHATSLAVLRMMDEARKQIGLVFPADR
ncbi:Gfo/Idh/MocA family protein [Cohnella faecalis]|uniref:Gfo/Idh/MocA family oxidoreductase n=1 Tax=Cohnella faecalis TaxID=2315694 RepID=A0A398CWD1_9BACL|nr:Gfo/Idh/MocA family oxidoreductase [Cohnella faecalis]RIE03521.1 gfo/Idh/MocA family oxidoreductase [Cohnella faecalis]